MLDLTTLDFEKGGGLVTVVAQDSRTGAVLMVAHADREALERTIATGEMHYRSRSRGLWRKGATSGHTQTVVSLAADCDGDAVLARVVPNGPACHTDAPSCFGAAALAADALGELDRTLAARAAGPSPGSGDASEPTRGPTAAEGPMAGPEPAGAPVARSSYTRRLLADRNLRLKKVGEEAAELVTACADQDPARATEEGVDLIYHALVALRSLGVSLDDLRRVIFDRAAR